MLSHGFTLKDVQEWLGHSDIKMTANVYGHLDVARKQSIADEMSALLTPRGCQKSVRRTTLFVLPYKNEKS